jgi:hypothetical protein
MLGEEVSNEVMLADARRINLGEEDFSHIGEAFCEDFNGLSLFVRII